MLGFLNKIFGSKSERDIKLIQPLVEQIKTEYSKLAGLSNDELRTKTIDFKTRIQSYLKGIDQEIAETKAKADTPDLPIDQKTAIYDQLDKLQKDRDKELEKVLMEILPEAFAVMKETARRFTENKTLEVTASPFDRELAARKNNVVIQGDKAIHHNTWLAAGTEVTWNMVHYDVQLIGGIVLHQGKIAEMATGEGNPYKGFIFIGLMNVHGEPYVIEYNVRMGDPETESVLPRIENDLVELFMAVAEEKLGKKTLRISPKTAVTIMLVSAGYPGEYLKGKTITGINNVRDSLVFHAGTELDNGVVKTAGGRVMALTSLKDNLFEAVQSATADAGRIYYDGRYFRYDVGADLF